MVRWGVPVPLVATGHNSIQYQLAIVMLAAGTSHLLSSLPLYPFSSLFSRTTEPLPPSPHQYADPLAILILSVKDGLSTALASAVVTALAAGMRSGFKGRAECWPLWLAGLASVTSMAVRLGQKCIIATKHVQ